MERSETEFWLGVAHELWTSQNETFRTGWSERDLAIWLRDRGECVYCGLYLLDTRQLAYHFYETDHLLPRHAYPNLAEDPSNLVLSCKACNGPKRRFDPNSTRDVCDGSSPLTDKQRHVLIERVKEHLTSRRAARDQNFPREKKLIEQAIKAHSRAVGAAASEGGK